MLLEFSRPQVVNHIRVSTNREYYYEVDYLTIKPKLDFSHMKIEGLGINGAEEPCLSQRRGHSLRWRGSDMAPIVPKRRSWRAKASWLGESNVCLEIRRVATDTRGDSRSGQYTAAFSIGIRWGSRCS